MKTNRIDAITGLVLCLISILIFVQANKYSGMGVNSYGPNFFPQALAVLLFIVSAGLIFQAVRSQATARFETINRAGFTKAAVTLGIAIVYLLLMTAIGFFAATFTFLYSLMFYLGQRKHGILLVTSLSVASAIYGIFHFFLKIPLPEGMI